MSEKAGMNTIMQMPFNYDSFKVFHSVIQEIFSKRSKWL